MKFGGSWRLMLILGCFMIISGLSRADQESSFQLSLFHPAQIFSDAYSVDGLRIDLIYGVNQDMQGIDLGIVNESQGSTHGFELGLDNRVNKDFGGGQFGLFNEVKRDFKGFQLGLIGNISRRSVTGFQASVFYNDAGEDLRGFQLGLVNHTGSLYGIQIGLINFNDDQRYKGFMPFINAAF